MGPKALDLLPPLDERTPAEVKQRLDRIKVLLQKEQAEAASANSTITLSGERMLLADIFQAIQEQTGNTIKFGQGQGGPDAPPVRLDVDYKDAPFWPTFDEILDRAGLTVDPYGLERTLSVSVARGEMLPRSQTASYDGPFRFQAVRVDASRDLRIDGDRSMSLTIEIAWEPRFRPISMQQRMSEIQIADENGEPVIIAARGAELEIPVLAEAISTEVRIPLVAPPRSVQKIAKLKGTMHALMQGKAEPFEFTDLGKAENVEKRAAGVTVILETVRKNRDVWEIRVLDPFRRRRGGACFPSQLGLRQPGQAHRTGRNGDPVSRLRQHSSDGKRSRGGLLLRHRRRTRRLQVRLRNGEHGPLGQFRLRVERYRVAVTPVLLRVGRQYLVQEQLSQRFQIELPVRFAAGQPIAVQLFTLPAYGGGEHAYPRRDPGS